MSNQPEEHMVSQDKSVNVNWLTVNVPSVVSILVVGIGIAMYVQALSSDVQKAEDRYMERKAAIDKTLDMIVDRLKPLENIPYRMDATERNLLQTNQRVDNYLQTLGLKIDGVSDRVNGLTTKVEVLGQKIDAISSPSTPPIKPSSFRP